jgi:uncharacterized LabA/DUF88 family protein
MAYIDGFNLYFGLRQSGWRKYYWLDLPTLVTSLLKPDQQLMATHYFTARIRANGYNAEDVRRQNNYIEALAAQTHLSLHFGHYLEKKRCCKSCGATWLDYEEKMTDVNIAAQLLSDAFDDKFDTAIIVSGDSDLTTPIQRVRQRFADKRIVVAFPPNRHSAQLKHVAHGYLTVGEDKLRRSQLPESVHSNSGYVLRRPAYWKEAAAVHTQEWMATVPVGVEFGAKPANEAGKY